MNDASKNITMQYLFKPPKYKGGGIPVTQADEVRFGLMIGAAQHMLPDQKSKRFDLCIVDLDAPGTELTTIPMDFFGHGIAPDPNNPERISVFEKRGKGACEFDLKQGAVTRAIETSANRQFYGHGSYSADGSLLYCTETIVEGDYDGLIAVRDANTLEYLGEFPSYGSSPHDCRMIDDGKTMVVTNGGGPMDGIAPNVSYIDVASQKLLEKLEFDARHVNAGHLDITRDGKLAVVSAQREGEPEMALGGISLRQDGILHTLDKPEKVVERLYAESLSVCIHEQSNIVGVTTPEANLLTFWNIDSGELLRFYVIDNPRGIELTLDGNYYVVSFGKGNPPEAMCFISTGTLEHAMEYDLAGTGITGSHLFAYSFPEAMRY